jgi:hypothetical protein
MWPSQGWERCIRPVEVAAAPREETVAAALDVEVRSGVWGDMVVAFHPRPGREQVERRHAFPTGLFDSALYPRTFGGINSA